MVCLGVSATSLVAVLSADSEPGYFPNAQANDGKDLSDKNKDVKSASITATSNQSAVSTPTAASNKSVAKSSAVASPQNASLPSSVLNLINWKLTLPIDTPHAGTPDEIKQPELSKFSISPYFQVNTQRAGVIFQAHAGGATTSNSGYPRSELREMTANGRQKASWSNSSGRHSMTIRQAITHLPAAKPHVVAGQIHDASDDVVMIRLERSRLFVESDGTDIGVLDANYVLGTVFTVNIDAADGRIKVSYNGLARVDVVKSGSGYYFKAGCYTQSNVSRGDSPGAYGEVIIYDLQVQHS